MVKFVHGILHIFYLMDYKMKKLLLILLPIFLLFSCGERTESNQDPEDYQAPPVFEIPATDSQLELDFGETFRLASFNIQVFGVTKASKPQVMDILVDIIDDFDMVAIQEIRDASGTAIQDLMELLPEYYELIIGPREGRTRSKEQYAIVYDGTRFEVVWEYTYEDPNDVFERSPHAVHFQSLDGQFDFVVINTHKAPGDAEAEIAYMDTLVKIVELNSSEQDIIIVGDFNADGSYYDEEMLVVDFPPQDYFSIIGNDIDTTVSPNNPYTYDRIIITDDVVDNYSGEFGAIYFDDIYDFISLGIEPKEVSDHYPVYAEFFVLNDQD